MIRLAFRNLFRQLRRTIAILLTVAMGSGALLGFQGFIAGVLEDFRENTIHAHHGYGQISSRGYRETVYEKPWNHWIYDNGELVHFLQNRDEVLQLFPRVTFSALLTKGNVSISGQGQGVDGKEEASFFNSLNIEEGETLEGQEEGILLGRGLANALNAKPGDFVTVMVQNSKGSPSKKKLRVTGLFHTGLVDFDSRVFRIQINQAQQLLATRGIESISLNLRSLEEWKSVAAAVEERFPHLEAASFAELDKVYYQNSVDWLEAQFQIVQIIILLIVLLGIFNTITSSILERKLEFGNLRANGESAGDVLQLIGWEGFFLGLFGTLIGVAATLALAKMILAQGILMPPGPGSTRQFYVCFSFDWNMILRTMALSSTAAVAATLMAGVRVVKMTIAEALRSH